MAYIRTKKIKGRTYYYLVKSVREGDRIRQVMLEYLGTEKPDTEKQENSQKTQNHASHSPGITQLLHLTVPYLRTQGRIPGRYRYRPITLIPLAGHRQHVTYRRIPLLRSHLNITSLSLPGIIYPVTQRNIRHSPPHPVITDIPAVQNARILAERRIPAHPCKTIIPIPLVPNHVTYPPVPGKLCNLHITGIPRIIHPYQVTGRNIDMHERRIHITTINVLNIRVLFTYLYHINLPVHTAGEKNQQDHKRKHKFLHIFDINHIINALPHKQINRLYHPKKNHNHPYIFHHPDNACQAMTSTHGLPHHPALHQESP